MTTAMNHLQNLRKTARWLRTPMAATMTSLDFQVRSSQTHDTTPGARTDSDLAALCTWVSEHYGRRPTGTTLEAIGAEIAGWYASELYETRAVIVSADAWAAVDRLTRSPFYQYGVGNQWEPAVPHEPLFAEQGVTVILDGGAPIASSFQDITPGAVPEHLAAITAISNGEVWSITEWCDATTALASLNLDGFAQMKGTAEQMAPWSIGGSYLTSTSGTASQFATNRIKSAILALHTEPPAPAITPLSLLSVLFDAVAMGLLDAVAVGDHLQIGPPKAGM